MIDKKWMRSTQWDAFIASASQPKTAITVGRVDCTRPVHHCSFSNIIGASQTMYNVAVLEQAKQKFIAASSLIDASASLRG